MKYRSAASTADGRKRVGLGWRGKALGITALVLLLVWVAAGSASAIYGARHLRRGEELLSTARSSLSLSNLEAAPPVRLLDQARSQIDAGSQDVGSPWLTPVGWLPVIGRQLRSLRALSSGAALVTDIGEHAIARVHDLLKAPHVTPMQRASLISQILPLTTNLVQSLHRVDLGPANGLIGPLSRRRQNFAAQLASLEASAFKAQAVSAALVSLLEGRHTYLVLASNNAEMRAGSGMFLEAGTLRAVDGRLVTGHFTPTSRLVLPAGAVGLSGDLQNLWGYEHPNREWRNLGLSPQFATNAALAAQMWKARTGQQIDGVISIDVGALADLLAATGPVTADGVSLNTADTESYLLHDQYQTFDRNELAGDPLRKEHLQSLLAAALSSVQKISNLGSLTRSLSDAVAGRHIMLWAANRKIEQDWAAVGASGQLAPDEMLLAADNQGANKLDWYLRMHSTVHITAGKTSALFTVRVTVANQTPSHQVSYVAGDPNVTGSPAGTYIGTLLLDIPGSAGAYGVSPDDHVVVLGRDGPSRSVGVSLRLLPGATTVVTYHFRMAGSHGRLRLAPSARLPATTWSELHNTFSDQVSSYLTW